MLVHVECRSCERSKLGQGSELDQCKSKVSYRPLRSDANDNRDFRGQNPRKLLRFSIRKKTAVPAPYLH